MRSLIYTIGHDPKFRALTKSGWGNGYCLIPADYLILKEWGMEQLMNAPEGAEGMTPYQPGDFSEEITLCKYKQVNGADYLLIGFDTCHTYNDASHDFEWVLSKTLEMQQKVEALERHAQAIAQIVRDAKK